MSATKTLQATLSGWRADSPSEETFALADNSGTVTLHAHSAETVGCLLTQAEFHRNAETDLNTWANQIPGRLSSLLEPLCVLEVDPARGEAILRSAPPTRDDSAVEYYELRLKDTNDATLVRYQGDVKTGRRETIPFALTHEALAKASIAILG